jgi:hypothetical protein
MSDWTKTGIFIAVALAISGTAVGTHFATRPKTVATEDLVGKPLFADFEADKVKSLEVVARDPVTQTLRRFKVENKDGVWRIPSHHNYPAEAAKRLFETASALYGLERLALAGRWTEDQKRFGVVPPDSESAESAPVEEIGQRIILRDAGGEALADLIIGRSADEEQSTVRTDAFESKQAKPKRFYVRRADEAATYVANFNVNLSTRFADWIEPDLLQLEQTNINKLVVDNYELQIRDELTNRGTVRRIGKLDKDKHVLTREKPFNPWQLEGLNPAKEQINNQNLSKILNLLDEMVIVGVRPKTQLEGKPLLNGDLTINTDFETFRTDPTKFQEAILDLQTELMNYGFNVVPGEKPGEKATFYSNRGEYFVSTYEGVAYNLYFGDSVQGSDEAIEIGGSATPTTDAKSANQNADDQSANKASDTADDKKPIEPPTTKKNRYLMVKIVFDPGALGPEPAEPKKPEEPVKPEGYVAAPTPETPAPPNPPDTPPTPPVDNRDPAFIEYDQKMAEFKIAQQKFEMDLDQYKFDSDDFKKRREEGERKAKRLGERFGPWFYVISADDLELLQISRADLVSTKATESKDPTEVPPAPSDLPPRPDLSLENN